MNWQTVIATLIVIAAALWWIRRMWRLIKSGSSSGDVIGCGTCHKTSDNAQGTPLIQLEKEPEDK